MLEKTHRLRVNKSKNLFVRTWAAKEETFESPSAILFIVHGLGEHSGRYRDFSRLLLSKGDQHKKLLIVAHDQRGHGMTSELNGENSGQIDNPRGTCGMRVLSEDARIVILNFAKKTVYSESPEAGQSRVQGIPYSIFGHSMGSLVTLLLVSTIIEGNELHIPAKRDDSQNMRDTLHNPSAVSICASIWAPKFPLFFLSRITLSLFRALKISPVFIFRVLFWANTRIGGSLYSSNKWRSRSGKIITESESSAIINSFLEEGDADRHIAMDDRKRKAYELFNGKNAWLVSVLEEALTPIDDPLMKETGSYDVWQAMESAFKTVQSPNFMKPQTNVQPTPIANEKLHHIGVPAQLENTCGELLTGDGTMKPRDDETPDIHNTIPVLIICGSDDSSVDFGRHAAKYLELFSRNPIFSAREITYSRARHQVHREFRTVKHDVAEQVVRLVRYV